VRRIVPLGVLAVALTAHSAAAGADGHVAVDVVVPDPTEPAAMAFWVARGAGFFEAAGVEVRITSPEVPPRAVELWQSRQIPAAVFGPAELLELATHGAPAVLVAQLSDDGDFRALCFEAAYADRHPEVALGMTRAVYRAEKLVHADPRATTSALMMAFPALDRRRLEDALRLYGPRVPADPRISVEDLRASLARAAGEDGGSPLEGASLGSFVVASFADDAVTSTGRASRKAPPPPPPSTANLAGRVAALAGLACVVLAWIVVTVRRRRGR
jgi:ABC-type nitrate/sulfonate/bicarbonate transport system substrate-binding protein